MIPTAERVKAIISIVEKKFNVRLIGLEERWIQQILLEWEKAKVTK